MSDNSSIVDSNNDYEDIQGWYDDLDDDLILPSKVDEQQQDEVAIYDSVPTLSFGNLSVHQTSPSDFSQKSPPLPLTEEVQRLRERCKALESENAVLKRNMGLLFRTARAELNRVQGIALKKEISGLNK